MSSELGIGSCIGRSFLPERCGSEKWRTLDEERSRSSVPAFRDLTSHAFGGNSSYAAQMIPGIDYWRTVLDGASGIDIYGHNGVSVADVDGDGLDDIYVCQPAGLPNRLFRNRGDGTFEDITDSAGVGVLEYSACALFADIDNDGRQDLIVVRASGPLLFLNQGSGKFRLKPTHFNLRILPKVHSLARPLPIMTATDGWTFTFASTPITRARTNTVIQCPTSMRRMVRQIS